VKARYLYRAWKARYRDQRLEISLALKNIRPGDVVVDAGANKGAYTYWLRRATGPKGRVLAYEPQASLAAYLQRACVTFGWNNVVVRQIALSDRAGIAKLHVPGGGVSPGASLEAVTSGEETFECAVETLDRELKEERVSFLKVDVEGHELALFKGAEQTLRTHRPCILFECEARHLARHSMQDVFNYLLGLRYRGSLLAGDKLLPLQEFKPEIHQRQSGPRFWDAKDYFNNFFFCPA
jgi:FkbM family methyltransferase